MQICTGELTSDGFYFFKFFPLEKLLGGLNEAVDI